MAEAGTLEGKAVLITGAARGIGAATARLAAERGARLSLVGLEPEELERVAAECGPEAVWFEADITDSDALDAAGVGHGRALRRPRRAGGQCGDRERGPDPDHAAGRVRAGDRDQPDRQLPDAARLSAGAARAPRLLALRRVDRRGRARTGNGGLRRQQGGRRGPQQRVAPGVRHLGVDVGVAYLPWLDTDLTSGADELSAFAFFRSKLRAPFNKTYPVSIAAEALVRGLERRSSRVAAPGWVRAALVARGALNQIAERDARKWAAELDRIYEQEIEAAARPVGAGGEAAARATESRR